MRPEDLAREVLSRRLAQQATRRAGAASATATQAATQACPMSSGQQSLWFLDRLDGAAGTAYAMRSAWRLRGTLDRRALKTALDGIVARHDVLRASFPVRGDGTKPVFRAPGSGFPLEYQDLTACNDSKVAVAAACEAETARGFSLDTGPLARGLLLRFSEIDHVLLVSMHHIVSDGWSMRIFLRELTALYATAVTGGPDPLDPLKSRYVDFARRQRAWLDGPECRSQRDFWRLTLKGAPTFLDLPTDRPRPAQQTYMGAAIPVRVPDPVTGALRAAARARGITPFMGLLAAWAAVLGARAGANEIVVGAPMANRLDRADEQLIGFFANTVALRVTMDPSSSVRGYLDSVRDVVLDALAHQELPFEKVVETVAPPRSMAYNPLFQVMLALDKGGSGVPELAGVDVASHPLEQVTTHFDLQLSLHDDGDHIAGSLKYAVDLFHAATAKQLVAHFVETLGALLVDEQADNPLDRLIAPMRHASHTDGYVALLSEVLDGEQEADDPDVLALENEISQIWLDLLGHDGFQRNQSFFEIGGTSLAALRMVSRLRESEGAEISLRDVFVHPSITALAKALVRRRKNDCPAASYDALVPVRPVGRQNPLFLVHPVEGSVGYVRSLAPHLPVTLPVFGLAAAGLVEGEQPPSDLNSMVDTYIAAMRRAQPDGPYRIAGWSAGGTLAYAMTEKLMASGERVSFLGLIDTRRIYEKSSEGAALRSWLRPGVDPAEALEAAELAAGGDIEAALALCREHRLISSDIDAAVLRRHLLVRRMISRAVCTYAPRKLSFAPVLVLANEDAPGAVESSWRTLVGDDMRTARVDGDHYSIVEPPYVAGLGRVIGEALGAS